MQEENRIENVWYIDGNDLKNSNKIVSKIYYRGEEFAVLKSESDLKYTELLIKDENNIYWKLGIAHIIFDEFRNAYMNRDTTKYCDDMYNAYINLDFNKFFEKKIERKQYFNKCELKYISIHFPKLYERAVNSRNVYIEQQKKTIEQRNQNIKEEQIKQVEKTNSLFEDKLANLKVNINLDKEIEIEDFTFYKDNKYENGKTIQNCILYLAKQYGINIPLATQGFINNRLVSYDFGNGNFSYKITKNNKRASTSMHKYLDQIRDKVKEEQRNNIEKLKEKIKSMNTRSV